MGQIREMAQDVDFMIIFPYFQHTEIRKSWGHYYFLKDHS